MIYDDLRINKNMINMWFSIANYEITIPDHVFLVPCLKIGGPPECFWTTQWCNDGTHGEKIHGLVWLGCFTGNHGYFPIFSMGPFRCQFSQANQSIEKMEVLVGAIDDSDLLKMIFFYVFPWEIHCLGNRLREYVEPLFGGSCFAHPGYPAW